jgi:polar amino acid transport system permease protein
MAGAQSDVQQRAGTLPLGSLNRIPWWLIIIALLIVGAFYLMLQSPQYTQALVYIVSGIRFTIILSVTAYVIALIIGLIAGLGRVSRNTFTNTLATVYVELVRGIPLLVIILYVHFVVAPLLGTQRNAVISGIIGLAFGYGAYLAEVYRAGIESIERGQMEAARSLGMSHTQAMRLIILPQAIRRVIPPLSNDFIAIVKDSSLVSAIAVNELTNLARIEGARSFEYFRALNVAAMLYLILTLLLSLGVRLIEWRTSGGHR